MNANEARQLASQAKLGDLITEGERNKQVQQQAYKFRKEARKQALKYFRKPFAEEVRKAIAGEAEAIKYTEGQTRNMVYIDKYFIYEFADILRKNDFEVTISEEDSISMLVKW